MGKAWNAALDIAKALAAIADRMDNRQFPFSSYHVDSVLQRFYIVFQMKDFNAFLFHDDAGITGDTEGKVTSLGEYICKKNPVKLYIKAVLNWHAISLDLANAFRL